MPLAPDVPYEIGDFAFGGYVAGLIDTTRGNITASDASQNGLRYLLIVAPASLENTSRQWKTAQSAGPAASRTRWDGLSATQAMNSSTYPAAQYCAGLSYPSDNGSPWYLPAMDELELIYRVLKPTTETNATSTFTSAAGSFPYAGGTVNRGYNPSSDPSGAAYTSTVPGQTTVPIFRDGGGQDLGDAGTNAYFWSSTEYDASYAWFQNFAGSAAGSQYNINKTYSYRVRPVRRVLVSDLNTAPDAPTLTAPADGETINRQQAQTFQWQFNDPDPGDSQSAYNWAYRLVGAATWTETGWVAVTSSQHTVPAGTFAEGLHEWRVATKDSQGAESPWSVTRTFTAYKAATGTGLIGGTPQLSASGVVAYHLDGIGVISVAHTRSAQGIKSTTGVGGAEQDILPVVSSGLRASRGAATIEAEPFVGIFTAGRGGGLLLVTAALLTRGTHQTQGEGLLYVTDVPTSTGHKWQHYFTPPGREVYGSGNRFWRRVHIEQGITVIKRDGAFIQVEHPSEDDFANADKIYVGGHLYQIDDLEHLDLEAAGYTTFYSEDGT